MKTIVAGVLVLATVGMAVALHPNRAAAKAGDVVITIGVCSNSNATWKMKAKLESASLIQLESEVDEAKPSQLWNVRLRQKGVLFFNENRRVTAAGNISVKSFRPNTGGIDTFTLRAAGPGGQVCNGSISL